MTDDASKAGCKALLTPASITGLCGTAMVAVSRCISGSRPEPSSGRTNVTTRRAFGAGLSAIMIAASASQGRAQSFPTRLLRFVVPFAAGSATDAVARIVGEKVSVELRQPVIVENTTGASGVLAAPGLSHQSSDRAERAAGA